jgi:signal transduction histidine kinase
MKVLKIVRIIIATFLFIAVNTHIGIDCIDSYKNFIHLNESISIAKMKENPPRFASTFDIDHDREDEIVFSAFWGAQPEKQAISIFEPFQKDYQFHYYGDIMVSNSCTFWGAYHDRKLKLYVFRFLDFEDGTLILKDIENNQTPRKSLKVKGLDLEFADHGMVFFKPTALDLDMDGKIELVTILKQDFERSKGVIICIDPESGKLLWKYETGPMIIDAEFKDLEGDGKREIILSTFASYKGIECNDTSDEFSYVIVLDCDGKERWKRKIGHVYTFSHNAVSDVDNDGIFEIISATEFHLERTKESGKIAIFDGQTGEPKEQKQEPIVSFSAPVVLKAKEGARIYVGDSNGNLWMFDWELVELEKIKVKEKTPVYALNASTGTNEWNCVFVYSQGQLMAYDIELKQKVFSHNFEPAPILIPLDTKKGNHALVNSDKLYVLSESKISFSKRLENLVKSGLLFNGLALLLFNGLFIFFFYRMRKTSLFKQQRRESTGDTSQFLEVFQGIAHKIKNPLSTIMWTAEKIKRSVDRDEADEEKFKTENYDQLADFLVEDVKILKQQTHNILKLIQIQKPRMAQKNLKSILERLVEHYRALLDETIEIQLDMEEDITIPIDENLFKEAIVNLIDNGIDAMPDGGKLTVSAVPVASPSKGEISHVLIEVEDTGIGMEEEEVSQIFTPFFSKKEKGTGIGLTICKRIIEAHGGKIEIHSRKDFGTKIALIIPKDK